MTQAPKTFSDVFNARMDRLAREDAKAQAEIAERQRIEGILVANPEIGVLMRKGGPVYYVNWPVYREAKDPASLVTVKAEG